MLHSQLVRRLSLLFFLALISWLGYRHQILGGGPDGGASVDALCPFGGLEGLYSYLKTGAWLRRLAPSSMVLFGATLAMTMILGRVFCGWICPMGALTEFSSLLARKMGVRPRSLPRRADFFLRGLKHLILIAVLYFTWTMGTLAFRDYDPWKAWMHITAIDEWSLATAVLGAVLLAEFFISRFWCRYLCPLGAFFALLQRVSPLKIRRNPDVCINCGKCDRACPTGLSPSRHVGLAAGDCIACGMCVDACPRQGALDFALPGRKRIVPVAAVGLSGILIFGLCYGAAKISGHWQTFSSSFQVKNPADKLFGWMTLQKMADETHLSVEQVLELTGLPPDTPVDVPVKRLPGVEDDAVTGALRAYFVKNPAPRSGRGEGKGRNRRLESREEATPSSL